VDWSDSPDQRAFREQVRELIEAALPEHYREQPNDWEADRRWEHDRVSTDVRVRAETQRWTAALAERGWAAPHWPREYGGGGLTPIEQFILKQELAAVGAPQVGGQAVTQLGPTLIIHGREEQKRHHLPKALSGERFWAQGYSEPGAGSDLASLQTRAVRDGDEYVLNGQKIWTSLGHYADWLYVLARTDPEAPKHRGISFFLVDAKTPGITVRPLPDMAGRHHFNEVFFEEVRVPAENLVGEEHRGWYVAVTLLDFERSNIHGAVSARRILERMCDTALEAPAAAPGLRANRLTIADRLIEVEVMFNLSLRIVTIQDQGLVPNYEASMSKVFFGELMQRIALTGMRLFGLRSMIFDATDHRAPMGALMPAIYLVGVSRTIAGGTNEIQRNIIATRGLGLPRG
jgi:alkylation response protein AidB-like acyl-CoA dehydrogenase